MFSQLLQAVTTTVSHCYGQSYTVLMYVPVLYVLYSLSCIVWRSSYVLSDSGCGSMMVVHTCFLIFPWSPWILSLCWVVDGNVTVWGIVCRFASFQTDWQFFLTLSEPQTMTHLQNDRIVFPRSLRRLVVSCCSHLSYNCLFTRKQNIRKHASKLAFALFRNVLTLVNIFLAFLF